MREYISKIKILDSAKVSDVKKSIFFSKTKYFTYFAKIRMLFLTRLLRVPEGGILSFKTNNQVAFRSLFSNLISKGFLESFGEGYAYNDYPKIYTAGLKHFADSAHTGEIMRAWGYVFPFDDKELAYAKALGEALERSALCFTKNSTSNRYPKLVYDDASFLFQYMPKFTKEQVDSNNRLMSSSENLTNIRGFFVNSLTGDAKRFLPLPFLYWGDNKEASDKVAFHDTSSGSGGGVTYEYAFLSATYELIERDHFLLYWFSGVQPKRIDNESIDGPFGEYVRRIIKQYNLEIYFLDTRYDAGVLSCVCIVVDPVLNIITMGGKAHSSSVEVLKSSLLEALTVMSATREDGKMTSKDNMFKILENKTFVKNLNRVERVNLYCSPDGISMIKKQFLQGQIISYTNFSSYEKKFKTPKEERAYLLSVFRELIIKKGNGYHLYEHRAHSKWTDEVGYDVVRVFVPSFLKLHLEEILAVPVSDRLFSFAQEKGKMITHEGGIVKLPHFFP